MGRELRFHPEAIEEAKAARLWYSERSISAGAGFVRELDRTLTAIQEAPHRWADYLHGTKRKSMARYPYRIVYRFNDEYIVVIAVAHGRRRPGYWRTR